MKAENQPFLLVIITTPEYGKWIEYCILHI